MLAELNKEHIKNEKNKILKSGDVSSLIRGDFDNSIKSEVFVNFFVE